MGTKAIRFTDAELSVLEQLIAAAGEKDPGNEGLQALWLKVTGRKPAPKAKAPKEFGPVASARAERLQACATRDQARELLTERGMTVAVLREVGKILGLGAQSRLRKDELVDSLIHFTVGMRLAHAAVLNAK